MVSSARIDVAVRRLERAAATLEQRLGRRMAEAGAQAGGLFDLDRARLAADLDACRAQQRELTEAAQQSRTAVEAAISRVQSALGDMEG